jgi:hypothetical protein
LLQSLSDASKKSVPVSKKNHRPPRGRRQPGANSGQNEGRACMKAHEANSSARAQLDLLSTTLFAFVNVMLLFTSRKVKQAKETEKNTK